MARQVQYEADERVDEGDSVYDRFVSVEEYLRIEETSPVRHVYVGGMLYAMTGGSLRHSELVGNIFSAVRPVART